MKLIKRTKLNKGIYLFKYLDVSGFKMYVAVNFENQTRTDRDGNLNRVMDLDFIHDLSNASTLTETLLEWRDKNLIVNFKGDL